MSKTVVLVSMAEDDGDAQAFVNAIENDAELRDRIELRFANREQTAERIADAQIAACGGISSEALAAANNLRWLAFWSAGLDGKITPEMTNRNLLDYERKRGSRPEYRGTRHGVDADVHPRNAVLSARTNQRELRSRQQFAKRAGAGELTGQTLGIVGLGRIGEALTRRAKSFDMRVVATKRNPQARYESAIAPDAIYSPEELPRLLAESDHVCVCLPHTPETEHIINAEALAFMKPTAILYNIGRGKVVDEAALVAALQNGTIAGAGLDVFETEPLPADSLLWKMENVLITPHVSGVTPHYFTRFAAMFAANLKRYLNREPLQNLYDPQKGY